jgi:hypothetical protein
MALSTVEKNIDAGLYIYAEGRYTCGIRVLTLAKVRHLTFELDIFRF